MLSDAPRYVESKGNKLKEESSAKDEANEIAGFFRSNLTQ